MQSQEFYCYTCNVAQIHHKDTQGWYCTNCQQHNTNAASRRMDAKIKAKGGK